MIRRMEERDIPEVAELERICFSECWSARILESGIHSPYDVYYVFEQDERILGYCNLRVLAGEGEVQRIAVHPDSRRYGVGRKMMDAMVEYAVREGACAISFQFSAFLIFSHVGPSPFLFTYSSCSGAMIHTSKHRRETKQEIRHCCLISYIINRNIHDFKW